MALAPEKTQNVHLRDMLNSARKAASYVKGKTFEEFWDSEVLRDAVALRVSMIGEAARHITPETGEALPEIPFDRIRGMRNRIAHDYDRVNFKIVWEVVTREVPTLVVNLDKHLERERRQLEARRKAQDERPPSAGMSLGI